MIELVAIAVAADDDDDNYQRMWMNVCMRLHMCVSVSVYRLIASLQWYAVIAYMYLLCTDRYAFKASIQTTKIKIHLKDNSNENGQLLLLLLFLVFLFLRSSYYSRTQIHILYQLSQVLFSWCITKSEKDRKTSISLLEFWIHTHILTRRTR